MWPCWYISEKQCDTNFVLTDAKTKCIEEIERHVVKQIIFPKDSAGGRCLNVAVLVQEEVRRLQVPCVRVWGSG